MDELIGPGEAARRLGVSTRTVQRWLRSGQLPSFRVGARLKVPVSSLSRSVASEAADLPSRSVRSSSSGPSRRPIRRLLVANRGELVVRIARTGRAMGVEVVGLVSADQRETWWAQQLAQRVDLPTDYLDGEAIIGAAQAAGVDAIHPGYGFLAERADFAAAVEAAGLVWVGPPPAAMRALGDKGSARQEATQAGVPIVAGYDGRGQSDAVLLREAERIGYPILVKPSAGGGGKGMHVVRAAGELRSTLVTARREAEAAFGDRRLILERYLDRPRHVEVQVLLDAHGNGVHLGERDCSLQRRHQKVVEESPAPAVDAELRARLGQAALRLARRVGYLGVGTAEFLLDDDGSFVFLEMNARLQVEHPVTEAVTGIDLVAAQLRVAAGEPLWLAQGDIEITGHAIEARLYAEDPWNGFLPAAGRVAAVRWPAKPGVRVDAGTGQGDEIGTRYDPLLAKLVASGPDRATALATLRAALDATRVTGLTTNRGFLAWLVEQPEIIAGTARTDLIDARWHPSTDLPESVWSQAARVLWDQAGLERSGRGTAPAMLGFRLGEPPRLLIEVDGERRAIAGPGAASISAPPPEPGPGSAPPMRDWAPAGDGDGVLLDVDGRAIRARLAPPPTVEAAQRSAHHGAGEAATAIRAPMPGVVVAVAIGVGQAVEAHQVLVTLEAMKMENSVSAPADGIVERVLARPGQAVQRDDLLVELTDR